MKGAFVEQCADLWDTHQEKFMAFLNQAEVEKINLTFRATLDFTESKAGLETTIGYSQVVKDKRRTELDNPDQIQIPGTSREDVREAQNDGNVVEFSAPRKGRKKASEPSKDAAASAES